MGDPNHCSPFIRDAACCCCSVLAEYRYTFFKFSPGDLTPPYWINMGAMAISALAGSLLSFFKIEKKKM
jgi:hypothetical protein